LRCLIVEVQLENQGKAFAAGARPLAQGGSVTALDVPEIPAPDAGEPSPHLAEAGGGKPG